MPRDLLRSQRLRMVNQQGDALHLGMNRTEEDLGKPQVLVDSADAALDPSTALSPVNAVQPTAGPA